MSGPPLEPHNPVWEHHRAELVRVATRLVSEQLRSRLDPEDLVQQTLAEVWRGRERLSGLADQEVRNYLLAALRNNAHDEHRRPVPRHALEDSSRRLADWFAANHTSPSAAAQRVEWFARLAVAVQNLPAAQRVAVEMRYLRGLPVAEIARELSRSIGAVSLLLHRALASLRNVLSEPNA